MQSFGKNSISELEVFGLHAESLKTALNDLLLPTKCFTALIVCDADQLTVNELGEAAGILIDHGMVYGCFWGNGCERFHDIDETEVEREILKTSTSCSSRHGGTLMTTWHTDDSLDEALWYLLSCAWPLDNALESCSTLVVTIKHEAWTAQIANRLENIEQFRKEMMGSD